MEENQALPDHRPPTPYHVWDGGEWLLPETVSETARYWAAAEKWEEIKQKRHDNLRGGVRVKKMELPSEKWDLIPLHDATRADLDRIWQAAQGKRYDWAGAIGTVLKIRQRPDKWFCSEFCAAVMGIPDGWRFSPNDLAALAKSGAF